MNLFNILVYAQVSKQNLAIMVLIMIYEPCGHLEMHAFSMQRDHEINNATAAS